ncbi:MAG: hypothetical protein WA610_02760 [Thermodesulfovibrionales bacterium]
MKRHEYRPKGTRAFGRLLSPVLALAIVAAFALPAGNALAAYTFSYIPATHVATAAGNAAVDNLQLVALGGLVFHSVNGGSFDSNWSGVTVPAAITETINVTLSTGNGSVIWLGNAFLPAGILFAAINVVAPANTSDTTVIDDSANSSAVTYVIDTLPGYITAPGINYRQNLSQAFQGGVILQGGSAGNTFNVLSVCCGGATHEPVSLYGGNGNDTFLVPASNVNSPFPAIDGGDGSNTIDMTAALALPSVRTVDLAAGTIAELTSGGTSRVIATSFANIDVFKGNGQVDVLRGPDATNTWSIDGITAGSLTGGLSLSGFPNIVGGTGHDTFTVVPSATSTITIDGGLLSGPTGDSLIIILTQSGEVLFSL